MNNDKRSIISSVAISGRKSSTLVLIHVRLMHRALQFIEIGAIEVLMGINQV